jgi:peptidoglycan hydrolase-like protein with peptidoglycan-binding domain
MELQGQTLKVQMQGEDVKLLQTALQQLGYGIPRQETDGNIFGPATEQADPV